MSAFDPEPRKEQSEAEAQAAVEWEAETRGDELSTTDAEVAEFVAGVDAETRGGIDWQARALAAEKRMAETFRNLRDVRAERDAAAKEREELRGHRENLMAQRNHHLSEQIRFEADRDRWKAACERLAEGLRKLEAESAHRAEVFAKSSTNDTSGIRNAYLNVRDICRTLLASTPGTDDSDCHFPQSRLKGNPESLTTSLAGVCPRCEVPLCCCPTESPTDNGGGA